MRQETIIALTDDLMFHSRLEQHVRGLGYAFVTPSDTLALRDAAADAVLVLVDLHARSVEWSDAVTIAKEHAVPVLAYGRHTEAQLLRDARTAGADCVVPRSQLVEELPSLIAEILGAQTSQK